MYTSHADRRIVRATFCRRHARDPRAVHKRAFASDSDEVYELTVLSVLTICKRTIILLIVFFYCTAFCRNCDAEARVLFFRRATAASAEPSAKTSSTTTAIAIDKRASTHYSRLCYHSARRQPIKPRFASLLRASA